MSFLLTDSVSNSGFTKTLVLVRDNQTLGFARLEAVRSRCAEEHHDAQDQDHDHDYSSEYPHPGSFAAGIYCYFVVCRRVLVLRYRQTGV